MGGSHSDPGRPKAANAVDCISPRITLPQTLINSMIPSCGRSSETERPLGQGQTPLRRYDIRDEPLEPRTVWPRSVHEPVHQDRVRLGQQFLKVCHLFLIPGRRVLLRVGH